LSAAKAAFLRSASIGEINTPGFRVKNASMQGFERWNENQARYSMHRALRYSENAAFGAAAAVFQKVPEGCDGAAAASLFQHVCSRCMCACSACSSIDHERQGAVKPQHRQHLKNAEEAQDIRAWPPVWLKICLKKAIIFFQRHQSINFVTFSHRRIGALMALTFFFF
jgi:hypothetical protein